MNQFPKALKRTVMVIAIALPLLAGTILNGPVQITADWGTCFYVSKTVTDESATILTFQLYDQNYNAAQGTNPPPSVTISIDGQKKQEIAGWSDPSTNSIYVTGPVHAGKHQFQIHVASPSKLVNLSGKNVARGCP